MVNHFPHTPLAIVDVETTGLNPRLERVIEIGILRVEDGKIKRRMDMLINPVTYVPPFITEITGITNRDVESAPTFYDRYQEIFHMLDGALFVAHNAPFDYGFLREEFNRVGLNFEANTLCTARLSRKIFPEHHSHSLSSLIERYGFKCARRHRAFDDAEVLHKFLRMLGRKQHCDAAARAIQASVPHLYRAS